MKKLDTIPEVTTEEHDTEQIPSDNIPAALLTATLPANYLKGGYYATAENNKKYLRPELVSNHAKEVAAGLATMKPTDFAAMIRELKRSRSRSLPFEARQTAACELLPKAIALVRRKKATQLLITLVEANLENMHCDDDFTALYRHFEAIYGFLSIPKDDEPCQNPTT